MATLNHLDTHVVVWLAAEDKRNLRPVWRRLEKSVLAISPAVHLELELLYDIGRISKRAGEVLRGLTAAGLNVASSSFYDVCQIAGDLAWTRDPFDRLIVATAMVEGASLITKDETILQNFRNAKWD